MVTIKLIITKVKGNEVIVIPIIVIHVTNIILIVKFTNFTGIRHGTGLG